MNPWAGRYPRTRARAWQAVVHHAVARAPPPGVFLDVGAWDGGLAAMAQAAGYEAIAVDADADARAQVRADMESLPLRDGTCRVVALCASLHHAKRPQVALAEAARLLGPGGIVALALTPQGPGHLRTADLRAHLAAHGLVVDVAPFPLGALGAWRRAKAALTRRTYASFPLVLARRPRG